MFSRRAQPFYLLYVALQERMIGWILMFFFVETNDGHSTISPYSWRMKGHSIRSPIGSLQQMLAIASTTALVLEVLDLGVLWLSYGFLSERAIGPYKAQFKDVTIWGIQPLWVKGSVDTRRNN